MMLKINDCQTARRGPLEIWCDTFKVKTGTGGMSVCVCLWEWSRRVGLFPGCLQVHGTAMESAVELLPSKDNHGKREERASLVAQRLKRLPAMLETRVQFLSWEDPLEKEMATYSSTLA